MMHAHVLIQTNQMKYFCPYIVLNIIIMARFSNEELFFVKELPKHVEIECPVCLNILTDPHLVSCCGHNFCGSCIERVKASNGSCPMCKEEEYQAIPDKKCLRIINGLEVYCSNKKKGCQWKGELKNMSTHLNKEKREGECQYESVKCRYKKCQERKQRRYLEDHEDSECYRRPFECKYCGEEGTFLSITKDHYEECRQYPVTCPNKCSSIDMPKDWLNDHVKSDCPLQPVDCVFSWAGCNDKPLRKDVHVHTADTKHMTLLAVACGQLKKENEKIQKEMKDKNDKMKEEVETLKKENTQLKEATIQLKDRVHYALANDGHPLLPIYITEKSRAFHFYTGACGRHMSARIVAENLAESVSDCYVLLGFHGGNFDKFKPKLPKIFAKFRDKDIPLIEDTEATYEQLHYTALHTVKSCEYYIPEGVIKIKLGPIDIFQKYRSLVTVYAK